MTALYGEETQGGGIGIGSQRCIQMYSHPLSHNTYYTHTLKYKINMLKLNNACTLCQYS